jgi:hypothetical protein
VRSTPLFPLCQGPSYLQCSFVATLYLCICSNFPYINPLLPTHEYTTMSTRAQHNDQHSRRHARYHCDICYRPFDRKDVLSRHMRVHDERRAPRGARRKACQSCAQSKTRCDGERPTCSSCARRDVVCSFDNANTLLQGRTQETITDGLPSDSAEQNRLVLAQSPTQSSSFEYVSSDLTPPASGSQSIDSITNQTGFDFHSPKAGLGATADQNSNDSNGLNSDLLFMPFDNIGFNTNLDWIFESSSSEHCEPNIFLNTINGNENSPSQLLLMSAPQSLPQSATTPATIDNPGEGGPLGSLLIPQPQNLIDHGDPWPLEVARPPLKHIVLPPLNVREQQASHSCGRYFNLMPVHDRTWHALQRCIRLPFEHNTLQTLDLGNFPSKDELDQCIDLYFAHFQPMLSVIHQPTFDPGRDLVVTIAIICIGACYTQLPGSREFSITLSELNRRLLVFMAEHDHRFVRTQSYLVAQLLQGSRKCLAKSDVSTAD